MIFTKPIMFSNNLETKLQWGFVITEIALVCVTKYAVLHWQSYWHTNLGYGDGLIHDHLK